MSNKTLDDKYALHTEEVLKEYRRSLPKEERWMVTDALKETMSALRSGETTSRFEAYKAALIVRRAYKSVRSILRTTIRANQGQKEAVSSMMLAMTSETWALRVLGYGTDDYHPLLEQGKIRYPPLVRFENRTPQPEHRKPQFPNFKEDDES